MWTYIDTSLLLSVHSLRCFIHDAIRPVGLDICMMIYIHHYSITQSDFTALRILCALPVQRFPKPLSPWIFLLSPQLSFSRISYSWMKQYVIFPDWLLLLSDRHLSFLPFHCLIAHYFLVLKNSPLSQYNTVIYPFTYSRILVAHKFGSFLIIFLLKYS